MRYIIILKRYWPVLTILAIVFSTLAFPATYTSALEPKDILCTKAGHTGVAAGGQACMEGIDNASNANYCAEKYTEAFNIVNLRACEWGRDNAHLASDNKSTFENMPEAEAAKEKAAQFCAENPNDAECQAAAAAAASKPTCTSELFSIGWVVCGALEAALVFADGTWVILEFLMFTNPLQEGGPTYDTWVTLRNIANALLALAFLFVIFSQITNLGISNYGIKKILPRFIIMAVLINVSYFLIGAAVDLANILGKGLDNLIAGTATADLSKIKFVDILDEILQGGVITLGVAVTTAVALPMVSVPAALLFLAILIVPAVLGFIAAVIALFIRGALVPIIAVLAPVAMAAYVLPNTQSLFDKWLKVFSGVLFLYPAASLYFGALKLGTFMAITSETGLLTKMIAMSALLTGSGFIFVMAIKSNAIMGKISGTAAGVLSKVAAPITKAGMATAAGKQSLKFGQFKNLDHSPRSGPGSRGILGRKKAMRGIGRAAQWFDNSSMARKTAMDAAGVDSQERFKDKLLEGYDPDNPNSVNEFALKAAGGDMQAARAMQRKVHLARKEEDFKKASAELNEDFNRAKATVPGFNDDNFLEERILTANSDAERDAALHRAASMGRDQVIRNVQNAAHFTGDNSLKAATNEAIEANKSALLPRSPDLIKGEDAAFSSVTGRQLTQFSNDTLKTYMRYIGQTNNPKSITSFNSAMTDIRLSKELQADLRSDAGLTILDTYNQNTSQLSGLSPGVGLIDRSSGKIR